MRLTLDGGRLYVYSDGVSEGHLATGGMLGAEGLRRLIDACADAPPSAQIDAITAALARAVQEQHQWART